MIQAEANDQAAARAVDAPPASTGASPIAHKRHNPAGGLAHPRYDVMQPASVPAPNRSPCGARSDVSPAWAPPSPPYPPASAALPATPRAFETPQCPGAAASCAETRPEPPDATNMGHMLREFGRRRWTVQDVVDPGKVGEEALRAARVAYRAEVVRIMQKKRSEMAADGWAA